MPQMSSMDETYHTAQDIIYALHNPVPAIPLVKLGHGYKEALKNLVNIFRKSNPPAVLIQRASSSAIRECSPASDNNYMYTQLIINTNRNYDL